MLDDGTFVDLKSVGSERGLMLFQHFIELIHFCFANDSVQEPKKKQTDEKLNITRL